MQQAETRLDRSPARWRRADNGQCCYAWRVRGRRDSILANHNAVKRYLPDPTATVAATYRQVAGPLEGGGLTEEIAVHGDDPAPPPEIAIGDPVAWEWRERSRPLGCAMAR